MTNQIFIEKLITEANNIKIQLLETPNGGNTVLSPEQAQELIQILRDNILRELLGED